MAVAIDKYTCPFCGQKAIFVGVHDDEGNYKGRPGCEYESDPWSGLCYAIHHDGWGDCILCTDAHDLPLGGCFFDTAEEAFQAIPTLTQPNVPLVTGFDVVDTKTGEYPDLEKIALKEDWAKHLMYCDMEGFAIEEDGTLLLLDECGRQACCPVGRFEIRRPPEGEEEEKHVIEITENL